MKNLLFLVGGVGIAAFVMVLRPKASRSAAPVEELAHKLQDAWADHHTVA